MAQCSRRSTPSKEHSAWSAPYLPWPASTQPPFLPSSAHPSTIPLSFTDLLRKGSGHSIPRAQEGLARSAQVHPQGLERLCITGPRAFQDSPVGRQQGQRCHLAVGEELHFRILVRVSPFTLGKALTFLFVLGSEARHRLLPQDHCHLAKGDFARWVPQPAGSLSVGGGRRRKWAQGGYISATSVLSREGTHPSHEVPWDPVACPSLLPWLFCGHHSGEAARLSLAWRRPKVRLGPKEREVLGGVPWGCACAWGRAGSAVPAHSPPPGSPAVPSAYCSSWAPSLPS